MIDNYGIEITRPVGYNAVPHGRVLYRVEFHHPGHKWGDWYYVRLMRKDLWEEAGGGSLIGKLKSVLVGGGWGKKVGENSARRAIVITTGMIVLMKPGVEWVIQVNTRLNKQGGRAWFSTIGESVPGEPVPGEPDPGEPGPGEPGPGEPSPGQPGMPIPPPTGQTNQWWLIGGLAVIVIILIIVLAMKKK